MKVYMVRGGIGYGASVWGIFSSRELANNRAEELCKDYMIYLLDIRDKTPREYMEKNKQFYPQLDLSDLELLDYCRQYYPIEEVDIDSSVDIPIYYE